MICFGNSTARPEKSWAAQRKGKLITGIGLEFLEVALSNKSEGLDNSSCQLNVITRML